AKPATPSRRAARGAWPALSARPRSRSRGPARRRPMALGEGLCGIGANGIGANGMAGGGVPLAEGESVKYWSTSRSKWVGAVVKAVDACGAVQLNVKPNVWVGRLEQAAKAAAAEAAPAHALPAPGPVTLPEPVAGR
ncbi:unnamed protein product, partial [Prorocentrum cordatum]